jgi:uncharacterized protein YjiS (DUF1127 family)
MDSPKPGQEVTTMYQELAYPRLRGALHDIAATLRVWRERIRARRALAQIDERSLREAGISPGLAEYEMRQPFWRPLRQRR